MSVFYVTGGRQRPDAEAHIEWFSYGEALVVKVEDEGRRVAVAACYRTPDEIRPEDPRANIVFKAGSRHGDRLLVCTQTEILTYELPGFRQVGYATHPYLNDAHHVTLNAAGNYLVADTGLDLVLELTPDGQAVREWSALPEEDPWERFDRSVDYRKVVTTKPHHAHPNYVFEHGGDLWVSRFVQRDALCLSNGSKRIEVGLEKIHDGQVIGDRVWFTTVDGHLVQADLARGEVLEVHDLNELTGGNRILGWCRGLHVLGGRQVLVGFSRIRPSRFKENVRWAKHKAGMRPDAGSLPTRISCFDLDRHCVRWEADLEKHGLNAVFSILPGD